MKNIIYLFSTVMLMSHVGLAAQPNELHSSCAATPEELYQKPETLSRLQKAARNGQVINLNALKGVWLVQGIPFRSDKIGVDIRADGFYVQIQNLIRKASVCIDEERDGWLRISLHQPRCPENKNIYVEVQGPNAIEVEAYQTRLVGSADFIRISNSPEMNAKPQPLRACARNFQEL